MNVDAFRISSVSLPQISTEATPGKLNEIDATVSYHLQNNRLHNNSTNFQDGKTMRNLGVQPDCATSRRSSVLSRVLNA